MHQTRPHPDRHAGSDHGFSLMELLVTIAVVLVVTLIVIPNLSGFKTEANENAAIASVRSIYQAQIEYRAKYPTRGFACSLTQLGGNAKTGPATPDAAQLLPQALAAGEKSGYRFRITNCSAASTAQPDQTTGFEITAQPLIVGKTGHRGFCEFASGEQTADPTGGDNCSVSVQ